MLTITAVGGAALVAGWYRGGSNPERPATAAVTAPPRTAAAILGGAIAALRSGGPVHITWDVLLPTGREQISQDLTATAGREVVTFGTAQVTFLLVNGVGYVEANQAGMGTFLGQSDDTAELSWGEWISLRPGDRVASLSYQDVTSSMTLPSFADGLAAEHQYRLAPPDVVNGQPVVGVESMRVATPPPGRLPLPLRPTRTPAWVLYAADTPQLRPVLGEVQGDDPYRLWFSRWHEQVRLTAPRGALPASYVKLLWPAP